MNYYYKKNFYQQKDIIFASIYFDNNDLLSLKKSEIIDFNFEFYDKMIIFNEKITPVVKNGYIKLNISKYKATNFPSDNMDLIPEYNKNRKSYIENRCLGESGITNITFYNSNHWGKSVVGQFIGKIEDGFLILTVKDIWPSISSNSDNFYISLHQINKNAINKITLDFENCETIDIYNEEIEDINLKINEKLDEHSTNYCREIIGGFIKIKLDPKITWRNTTLLIDAKQPKLKHIKRRLRSKHVKYIQNICRLYIYYEVDDHCESIEVRGVWKQVYKDGCWQYEYFVSGYGIEEENNIIALYFEKYKSVK